MGKDGLTSVLELKVSGFLDIRLMVERSATDVISTAQIGSYVTRDVIVHRPQRHAVYVWYNDKQYIFKDSYNPYSYSLNHTKTHHSTPYRLKGGVLLFSTGIRNHKSIYNVSIAQPKECRRKRRKTYPLAPQLEQEPPAPPLLHSFAKVYPSAIIDLE